MTTIPPVQLAEYSDDWPQQFRDYKLMLLRRIGACVLAVEHIGSTAIPGLTAKPEIDMLVSVKKLSDIERCIDNLADIGFDYFPRFEQQIPDRKYFRKTDWDSATNQPLVHVHVVEHGSAFWQDNLLFRNYLIAHPEKAKEYASLKETLLKEHGADRPTYSENKKAFVERIIAEAKSEHTDNA